MASQMAETWEGSPMSFGGGVYLLLVLSVLGTWAGGCGESLGRGEPPKLPPDPGSSVSHHSEMFGTVFGTCHECKVRSWLQVSIFLL